MAFSLGGGSSGGFGRSRFRGTPTLSEINVVPLVDVVLVLLIIFMLTAHVMEFGMEVDVPKVRQTEGKVQDLPVVSVTREGESFLNEKPVNINLLGDEIRKRYSNPKSVYLRADKGATWDSIAQVISALGQAKLAVNVVTQPEESVGRHR
jgi:biopolymer transport protein ExbD